MKPQIKKMFAVLSAATLFAVSFAPVYATVDETQPITENKTAQTEVTYTQGSTFTVTIPKKITLDSTKQATYTVGVEGDIASNEAVTVTPDATVIMVDENEIKDDVTGTVTLDKKSWGYTEIVGDSAVVGNGTISATDLTAGVWNGTFNFAIALETVQGN